MKEHFKWKGTDFKEEFAQSPEGKSLSTARDSGVVDRFHGAGVRRCTDGEIAQHVLGIVNTPMG